MDDHPLTFAFSPCPNDTFAFHALVHGLVPGVRVVPQLEDIEALNLRAERGEADITKVSMAAYGRVRQHYVLLHAGGAAGFGVGPIVVARTPRRVGGRVAIPGERTTAALLLRLMGRFETVPMRFDRIEEAVLSGEVDCGVLIHEGRFTYEARGLTLLEDLGRVWESRHQCPLPLAAIAIRRDLAALHGARVDAALRASVEHSGIRRRARRMWPPTRRKWILTSPAGTLLCMSTTTPVHSTRRRCIVSCSGPRLRGSFPPPIRRCHCFWPES